jgi:hypothetical protein
MKHVPPPTAEPLHLLETGLAVQNRDRETSLQHLATLRKEAAEEIERLLDFLDASDIDPDLEPTLGFMNGPAEVDECEVEEDREPSLGSVAMWETTSQDGNGWSGFSWNHYEACFDDRELDDCDDEPSLCGVTVECKGSMRDMEGPECA